MAKRAVKLEPLANLDWTDGVWQQLVKQVGVDNASIVPGLSIEDCAELASIAGRLLRGEPLLAGGFIRRALLGASLPELLARSLLENSALSQDESPVGAARALQASGIALCRQAGLPLAQCPCFQEPAGIEFEDVLFLLFRMALAHFGGLFIPFHPLAGLG